MQPNPYAPPQSATLSAPLDALDQAEALRREHIGTEATIKSVGALYYLGAFVIIMVGVASVVAASGTSDDSSILMALLLFVLGIGQMVVGYGLRRLRSWARIPTLILSGIGLLGFPIGTLINGYIMFKVLSKQGQYVMKPEYQQIIAATPQVKNKTSIVVWILLAILVLAIIGIAAAVLIPTMTSR